MRRKTQMSDLQRVLSATLTLSTALTLMRVLLVPGIVACILSARWDAAACLFIFAALTDVLDGACARLFDEETLLGKYLDPLADKILILSCYGSLIMAGVSSVMLPSWLLLFLIVKEILLVIGGIGLLSTNEALVVQPSWLGKSTMLLQTISVFWFFLTLYVNQVSVTINNCMYFFIFLFNALSLIHYLYKGLKGTHLWYMLKRSLWRYSS